MKLSTMFESLDVHQVFKNSTHVFNSREILIDLMVVSNVENVLDSRFNDLIFCYLQVDRTQREHLYKTKIC